MNRQKSYIALSIVVLLLLPLFIKNQFLLHMFILIFLGVIYGQSWNLLGGFTGQISFGHALFFGIGAYGTAKFLTSDSLSKIGVIFNHQADPILAIIFGGLMTILVTFLMGTIIFRLSGPYFGLGTLAMAEIGLVIAMNLKSVTNGGEGILLLDTPSIGPFELMGKTSFYYLILVLMLLTVFFVYQIMRRKMGYFLLAIREDNQAAEAMGVPTKRYKILALMASAFLSALAGGFYTLYVGFISPHDVFSVHTSVEMIFITIVGGVGTLMGPVVGAVVLTVLSEVFKSYFDNAYLIVYGLLLILVILYMPEGIYGYLKKKWNARKKVMADADVAS
ncbi:MAG: branched-chain amino acid ABC transporter permease [Bacillaceae bacterium]|nr:branched-chain amino acid ABC transporter permease [Bacillaceae bacterium]